jgi:integrase
MGELKQRGSIWWLRYYRNGRRYEESSRTSSYEDARDQLRLKEGDIAKGVPVSPRAAKLRFEEAVADVLTDYAINGRKTHDHTKRRIELHLAPVFRGRRMADITTADLRTFTKARLEAGASPAEINRELAIIKRAYSLAMRAGRLHVRPHIPMLAERNVRRGFLEPGQFADVLAHLPAALQPMLEFAYLTGWRLRSEVMPLEWRQVDWQGRQVRLDPGTTKSGEGRTFPFTRALEAVLVAQKTVHDRLRAKNQIVPLVFHRNGKAIRQVRTAWANACTAAGVPGRLLHDMRRSAVRNLERQGVSRSAAMAMVGHKTEAIYRRYAIVDAGALRDAAAKIDAAGRTTGTIAGTIAENQNFAAAAGLRNSLNLKSAGGGDRTRTPRRTRDFKSDPAD